MTPAAILSILVKTQGVGAAQADLRALDRTARNAGDGLKTATGHTSKMTGVLGGLKSAAALAGGAAGVTGLVLGVKAMNSEYREAQKATAQTNAVLKSTGGAANISRKGVEDLANAISRKSGIDDEAIQSGENLLLTFTNIRNEAGKGNDIFSQSTQAITDMSVALGQPAKSSALQLGKALQDPIKGVTALRRVGVMFTEQQQEQIKTMVKSGDSLGAQKIILRELNKEFGGSAAAQATASDKFGVALNNLAEAGGRILIPVLDKVVGVLTDFMNQMLDGKGVGGALVKTFTLIASAAKAIVTAVVSLVGWFKQHQTAAVALGAALGVVLAAFIGFQILARVQALIMAVRVAMLLLNTAFLTNPVVLVVAALAALAAGFVIAYRKSETFRNIVNAVFGAMKQAAGGIVYFVTHLSELPKMAEKAGAAILHGLVDGIKALPALLVTAAGWVKDRFIDGIKLYLTPYRIVGTWVLNRIIDGVKTVVAALASVGGWLKNRISDLIRAELAAFKAVGSWVLNRLVDGFKAVTGLLSTVGGWLKNRIVDFIHAEASGLAAVGGWVLNRIVDGIRAVTGLLATVGGWLKNRLVDAFNAAKDGFLGIGGSIIGWILNGLKVGANKVVDFLNGIVGKINILPFVHIGKIPKFAQGGVIGHAAQAQGLFAGGKVTRPMAIVGEEAPRHPEYVIPTNPAYSRRAVALHAAAGRELGIPGFAQGGVMGGDGGSLTDLMKRVWGAETNISGSHGPMPVVQFSASPMRHGAYAWFNSQNGKITVSTAMLAAARDAKNPAHNYALDGLVHEFAHARQRADTIMGDQRLTEGGAELFANWASPRIYRSLGIPYRQDFQGSYPSARSYVRRMKPDSWWQHAQFAASQKAGVTGNLPSPAKILSGAVDTITGTAGKVLSGAAGAVLGKLPSPKDLPDWLQGLGRFVVDKAAKWAEGKVGLGGGADPGGLVAQVTGALAWAHAHGWGGSVISGYRTAGQQQSAAEQFAARLGKPISAIYPHGVQSSSHRTGQAVDVTDPAGFARALANAPASSKIFNRIPWDPAHYSVTGYAKGGLLGGDVPFVGSYKNGGVIPRDGLAYVHQGETVTPAGGDTIVKVYIDGQEFRGMIRTEQEELAREQASSYQAGRL